MIKKAKIFRVRVPLSKVVQQQKFFFALSERGRRTKLKLLTFLFILRHGKLLFMVPVPTSEVTETGNLGDLFSQTIFRLLFSKKRKFDIIGIRW
jgi:hypothetical protein